jgi:hypothetical protein
MVKRTHVVNGEDSLHVHKHHMIQQTHSHTSTFVATNSPEKILHGLVEFEMIHN